jgi:hypothetical protein
LFDPQQSQFRTGEYFLQVEQLQPGEISKILADNDYVEGLLRAKMVPTRDGQFLKFFYDQPGLHWSSLQPKACRFTQNAINLNRSGFVAPRVNRLARCAEEHTWMVTYKSLPGEDVRALWDVKCLEEMAAYMARLHQSGVYFRGIHLGNILCQDEGGYALIDISGMTIWPMPLTIWQRLRNLGRFASFPEDAELFGAYGVQRFCDEYCAAARLKGWRKAWLTREVVTRVEAELSRRA